MLCDCKRKLNDLLSNHRLCSRSSVLFENGIFKTHDISNEIICSGIENLHIEKQISKEVVNVIMDEFVSEILIYKEDPIVEDCDEELMEEDETVELTDISPEELLQQEEEEKRIRDELALIQLTKLTKKRVRTKK